MRTPARLTTLLTLSAAAAVLAPQVPSAHAAGKYGDVTGKVVLKGEAPDLAPRIAAGATKTKDGQPVTDAAVCAASDVIDRSLVVGEGGGVANVFVYLLRAPRDIKPDLKDAPDDAVVFDQKGCEFLPHALIARTGQPILLKSQDAVAHNVRFNSFGNPGINKTVPAGDDQGLEVTLKKGQPVPVPAKCDFHAWMTGYWLIVDHPYAAVTDGDGNFTIEGLPAGRHTFTVWHETAGFLERRLTVTVKDGETTEVPAIEVTAAADGKLSKVK